MWKVKAAKHLGKLIKIINFYSQVNWVLYQKNHPLVQNTLH